MDVATELAIDWIDSSLVPSPTEYAALVPATDVPVPLLINLHGGEGSCDYLVALRPVIERTLPPMVVVTPSAHRSQYMDFHDGSERWSEFLMGPFLEHVRRRYPVSEATAITGVSMGGLGSLRLAFRHPDTFSIVAAMEPAIDPSHDVDELRPRNTFFRDDELFDRIYGSSARP